MPRLLDLAAVALLFFAGCSPTTPAADDPAVVPATRPAPGTIDPAVEAVPVIVLSEELREGILHWRSEALKRFDRPLLFACHGVTLPGLPWMLAPDGPMPPVPVAKAASALARLFPDHDIVLLVCNERGDVLDVANVWYVQRSVWNYPNDQFPENERWKLEAFDAHDDIFDFVTGGATTGP